MKMMLRRGTLLAIAVLVFLASVSFSESVKLRKPRKRTTTRTPYQQTRIGPVIIRVMHKYTDDDGLARGASGDCINGNCRNAHDKFNLDVNEALSEEDNFLSDEESLRYVVHPEKYEHFVLRKNAGHANRYKREPSQLHSSNASDYTVINASKVSGNENKMNVTLHRVPLHRSTSFHYTEPTNFSNLSKPLNETARAKRSLPADYSSRRNDSDYYAQRRAVMERYFARQREINARYANRTNISRSKHNDVSEHRLTTSNGSMLNFGRIYPSKAPTARNSATTLPSTKIDPIYANESQYNRILTELDSRRNVALEIGLGFKSDANLSQTRSSGNIERNALDYFVTSTPCTNLSGALAPKARSKHARNCTGQSNEDCDHTSIDNDNTKGNQQWGRCEGKIVYQHNLLLGLTGPSNLDALFEVIIQGPVCITCVQALRYNETRATVTLDSGGRGHEYAKLRLEGYENEGFSYIVKVWGVKKTGQFCNIAD